MKKKKLKKKELAVRIRRLVDQFSDLNKRLNRVSHDKLNQGQQLDRLSEANSGLQQRLQDMQTQVEQLISQEEELSSLLESLQLQTADETPVAETSPEQQETQRKLDDLNKQLATLHKQHQSFRHALEHDSQSADTLANNTDDLRRDVAELLSHMRRLEESGNELLVSDSNHESQIQRLQNDITELSQKLEQDRREQESSRQEVSRLVQESAQPLQGEIEYLRDQLAEKGGQQKALENRLFELANRIGETGARLESQQPKQQETQQKLDDLNEQLAILHKQNQSFRHTLEQDGQSADTLANNTDDLRRDVSELSSHMRRLEESGNELLVSDSHHESQIQRLQNDITELSQKLEQDQREQESSRQEVSRLLRESAQPLQHEIDHLKHLFSGSSGQQKALDNRLLELANRIGETGARLESQQQDKARKNEVLEQRLLKLEALVQDLQPVSNADTHQLAELEQKLNRVEGDMAALLADKSKALTTRLDSLDSALNEQAVKSASIHDLVNRLASESAGNSRSLDEQLVAMDLRLSDYIDQQADLPDPLVSIMPVIEEQKARFEDTARQLKQEISDLYEKLQVLDTDEHEAADWLSSIAANLDQQNENREQLQNALVTAKSDINRRIDEVKARLIITERQLKDQEEAAQDQLLQLTNLADETNEQGRHGVDLKLTTATLQEDFRQLKESNNKLNEGVVSLQRQTSQHLSLIEQEQKELRESSEVGMDSLQERIKAALAQLAEQAGLNEGLSQRLDDLESSLRTQFSDLDKRHHQLMESESEDRERLTHQEQINHALSTVTAELKTDHEELLEQSEKQKTFLEAMTSEYDKRQEESNQMTQQLGQLNTLVASTRSSGTYQGIAIGGLFIMLLLSILFGYQYLSAKLGSAERDVSLELMKVSENYLTKAEIDELMGVAVARMESLYDPREVEELIQQQADFEQRLNELEATGQMTDDNQDQTARGDTLGTTNEDVITDQQLQQQQQQLKQKPPQDNWQALRSRGGYTIQLIGVANEDSIPAFAAKHGLQGELAYITTEKDGKAWHILLHGMYDSYAAAVEALQNLPGSLQSLQPWARKMPGIGTISGL